MAKVVVLPKGIVRRKCPGCGYLTCQVCCPRCEKYKLEQKVLFQDENQCEIKGVIKNKRYVNDLHNSTETIAAY